MIPRSTGVSTASPEPLTYGRGISGRNARGILRNCHAEAVQRISLCRLTGKDS